uniref:Tyrosine-protein kinase n=1 Tax=Panagrellus redivivus TaxID=6233 RepID=A0A7E4VEJ9_PANRE
MTKEFSSHRGHGKTATQTATQSVVQSAAQDDENKCEISTIGETVRRASFYHGLMPRHDIEPLLKKDGDFLLRKTEVNGATVLALAVRWNGPVKHFMVNQSDKDSYYFETHHEKSVIDLVEWHMKTKTPVSTTSGAKLLKPIDRPPWILNHDSIKTIKKLGEGAFGEVYMAELTTDKVSIPVAVKTMREEVSRDSRLKFMKEARIMRKFHHQHVVQILGIAVHEHPLMLVMELCLGGSVLSYMRKHKGKTTLETKLRFVLEASSGLAYLEEKSCIHRDIAARNCLLTEKHAVKISDFGMSDERKTLTDERLDKVPVKWLAPETMQNKIYSSKTDVWSFGVMAYEIYSDGGEPYPTLTNIQTRAKIIVQNYRMEMPKDVPPAVVTLVSECWAKEPENRPPFSKIHERLLSEYKKEHGDPKDREKDKDKDKKEDKDRDKKEDKEKDKDDEKKEKRESKKDEVKDSLTKKEKKERKK